MDREFIEKQIEDYTDFINVYQKRLESGDARRILGRDDFNNILKSINNYKALILLLKAELDK